MKFRLHVPRACAFVFSALAEEYASSYNQPFYGESLAAQLSVDGVDDIDLAGAQLLNADPPPYRWIPIPVRLRCWTADRSPISRRFLEAKSGRGSGYLATSSTAPGAFPRWNPPSSGIHSRRKERRVTPFVFKTNAELGAYAYVRFYEISGEDQTEEGTLARWVYSSAEVRLRVSACPTVTTASPAKSATNWYGLEHSLWFGRHHI